jgi:GntR family transcriptional regulator/MocR family aminotransferase
LQTVIRLPDEDAVIRRAAESGLALSGLSDHFHSGAGRSQGIVVGFATPSQSSYAAALDALVQVLP